jgi:acyl carrier protein
MTDIEQSILGFVAEETGYNPKRLALDSRLAHDIGVDGDDAVELFQKFEQKYDVDLAALYEQSMPITVQEMVNAAINHKWERSYEHDDVMSRSLV